MGVGSFNISNPMQRLREIIEHNGCKYEILVTKSDGVQRGDVLREGVVVDSLLNRVGDAHSVNVWSELKGAVANGRYDTP